MSEFNRFSGLPQELQDQIWDMAIRDDEPAAQFFSIYNKDWGLAKCPVGLTAPHHSWVEGNESAYMTDSGLWTACRGSRARMLWRFKPAETSALMTRLGGPPVDIQTAQEICQRSTASVTMPYKRDNGKSGEVQCYLTIRPMEDLLFFHLPAGCFTRLQHDDAMYWWTYLPRMLAFRWTNLSCNWPWLVPLHIRHIALKYDPCWRDIRSNFGTHARPVHGSINGLEGFWLVDYALRRRHRVDSESDRRGRRSFRAGDDHEFVEVLETDGEWWDLSNSSNGGLCGWGASAVHDLARKLQEREYRETRIMKRIAEDERRNAQQNNDTAMEDDEPTLVERGSRQIPAQIGVLAYVKRGSERNLPTAHEWFQKNTGAI